MKLRPLRALGKRKLELFVEQVKRKRENPLEPFVFIDHNALHGSPPHSIFVCDFSSVPMVFWSFYWSQWKLLFN